MEKVQAFAIDDLKGINRWEKSVQLRIILQVKLSSSYWLDYCELSISLKNTIDQIRI